MNNSYSPSEGSAAEPEAEYSEDENSSSAHRSSSSSGDSPPKRKRPKKHHQKSTTSGKKKRKKEKKEKRRKQMKIPQENFQENSASPTYEEIKAAVLSVAEALDGEPFDLELECHQGELDVLHKSTCQNNPCVICGAKCFSTSNMSKHVWRHLGGILEKVLVISYLMKNLNNIFNRNLFFVFNATLFRARLMLMI